MTKRDYQHPPTASEMQKEAMDRRAGSHARVFQGMEADRLVRLAEQIGDDPAAFFAAAAQRLREAITETNPRTKKGRAYRLAAERFERLARQ
jgi:hypothetical protein